VYLSISYYCDACLKFRTLRLRVQSIRYKELQVFIWQCNQSDTKELQVFIWLLIYYSIVLVLCQSQYINK